MHGRPAKRSSGQRRASKLWQVFQSCGHTIAGAQGGERGEAILEMPMGGERALPVATSAVLFGQLVAVVSGVPCMM
jgi:hypothetical protein